MQIALNFGKNFFNYYGIQDVFKNFLAYKSVRRAMYSGSSQDSIQLEANRYKAIFTPIYIENKIKNFVSFSLHNLGENIRHVKAQGVDLTKVQSLGIT